MSVNCTIDSNGCIECPAIPASPGVPESITLSNNLGWNAGGDSTDALDGDLHYVFTMSKVVGAVTGLKADRTDVGNPQKVTHGFGFQSSGGTPLYFIVENGITVSHGGSYASGDTFEIRRVNEHVGYYRNGIKVYTSAYLSNGEVLASGCLYAADDRITEVVFESYSLVTGEGLAAVRGFSALGWSGKLATTSIPPFRATGYGHDIRRVSIPIPGFGVLVFDGTNFASIAVPGFEASGFSFQAPPISLGFAAISGFSASSTGHRIVSAEPVIEIPLFNALGFKGEWTSIEVPYFGVSGDDHNPFATGVAYMLQTPGLVQAIGDDSSVTMTFMDQLVGSDSVVMRSGLAFGETLVAMTTLATPGSLRRMSLHDSFDGMSFFDIVDFMILGSSVAAADTVGVTKSMLLACADALAATDALMTRRDALMAIATTIAAHDMNLPFEVLSLSATGALADEFIARVVAIMRCADAVDASDSVSMRLSLIMVFNDELQGDDEVSQLRHALMRLDDVLFVGGTFHFDGVDYVIYAMQPVGAAVSEYANFNFDSGFVIDGVAYGTSKDGVYALEGEDDDGTPIDASLYTGLSNLGTSMIKDSVEIVVGYTGDGSLMAKVFTMSKKGLKENTYTLTPTRHSGTTNARFTPSKGLHSVYFGFELANTNGGDFDIDFMKVWARPLNRRVNSNG